MITMCTKFTALEIGSGDAFLLEDYDNDWNCLFDAGGSKNRIVYLLKRKRIEELNLAICSHNDVDHANGFIGLLQSNINIDEIWLPGTWASVLKYVKDKGVGLDEVEFLFNVKCEYNEKATDGSTFRINEYAPFAEINNKKDIFDPESEETIENFDDSLSFFSGQIESKLFDYTMNLFPFLYPPFYWHNCKQGIEAKCHSLLLAIDRIIKIAGLAYQKGCKIKWFNPVDFCICKKVGYGFVALNSNEMSCVQKPRNAQGFALLCLLTVVNEYSLVFEYLKGNNPILRFSADSDCTCQSVPYNENIIVTAPHHGSDANTIVYKQLVGDNIIWVRSDRKSGKRPCCYFKCLNIKYCLACKKYNFISEICFEYNTLNKQWVHIKGTQCMC